MQAGGVKDRRMLSEINVTPLVDVILVLLIIFMVTTPMLQRGTDVQLPTARVSEVKEEQVLRENLEAKLKAMAGSGKERVVYFRGDARVSYGLVIDVMDAIKS